MRRGTFAGITLVAVIALALTAASVETVSVSVPSAEGTETPNGGGPQGCASNGSTDGQGGCSTGTGDGRNDSRIAGGTDDGTPTTADGPALWQVVASVALLTVGGVVVVYGLTRGDGTTVAEDNDETIATASPAEDRSRLSADAPPTNAVYRAWLALRAEVALDGRPVSPAAVAAAAVAAGFEESAVETLTREFCAVRYGQQAPTAERERRAREAADSLGLEVSD